MQDADRDAAEARIPETLQSGRAGATGGHERDKAEDADAAAHEPPQLLTPLTGRTTPGEHLVDSPPQPGAHAGNYDTSAATLTPPDVLAISLPPESTRTCRAVLPLAYSQQIAATRIVETAM
jgi:hypothetical protein